MEVKKTKDAKEASASFIYCHKQKLSCKTAGYQGLKKAPGKKLKLSRKKSVKTISHTRGLCPHSLRPSLPQGRPTWWRENPSDMSPQRSRQTFFVPKLLIFVRHRALRAPEVGCDLYRDRDKHWDEPVMMKWLLNTVLRKRSVNLCMIGFYLPTVRYLNKLVGLMKIADHGLSGSLSTSSPSLLPLSRLLTFCWPLWLFLPS